MHKFATIERFTESGPVFYVTVGKAVLLNSERRIYSSNNFKDCEDRRDNEEFAQEKIKELNITSYKDYLAALRVYQEYLISDDRKLDRSFCDFLEKHIDFSKLKDKGSVYEK